ncbi:hypothetical protein FACS1894208_08530 [Clostridia bacterium]|nr:hypothetical protein FACS1894208_08530 [Clostridia bacterium]
MIKASRLNGKEFYLNSDLIEFMEETPDTVLSMTTGKKLVVAESSDEIRRRVVAFRKEVFLGLPRSMAEQIEDIENAEIERG